MEWENSLIRELTWSGDIINREAKERIAWKIAQKAREGEVIGVGSGSTVYLALEALAKRMKQEKLHIRVIPASLEATMACIRLEIPVVELYEQKPDWTFDGADEVDPARNMIRERR